MQGLGSSERGSSSLGFGFKMGGDGGRGGDRPPLFSEDRDSSPRAAPSIRPPAKKFDWEEEKESREGETMDSLEKYRPQNYDFEKRRGHGNRSHQRKTSNDDDSAGGRSRDYSDINDLRDYYSSLGTRARALRRWNLLSGGEEREEEDDLRPQRKTSLGSYGGGGYGREEGDYDDVPQRRRSAAAAGFGGGGGGERDRFPHSRRFWLEEVDNARRRSGMPTRREVQRMEEEDAR